MQIINKYGYQILISVPTQSQPDTWEGTNILSLTFALNAVSLPPVPMGSTLLRKAAISP